VVIRQ